MTEDRHNDEDKRSSMSGSVRATEADSRPFFGAIWYKDQPVPTWTDIKDHARSSYKLAEEHDQSYKLVFEYPGGRLQAVIVSHYQAMGRSWIDMSSACCRVERMDPHEALQQSFNLAVGSLCLDGDVYVVRHTMMVDHLQLADIEVPMHEVARAADQIEQSLPTYEPASDMVSEVEEELA